MRPVRSATICLRPSPGNYLILSLIVQAFTCELAVDECGAALAAVSTGKFLAAPDEVHVWLVRTDSRNRAGRRFLSPDECGRADRFRFERDRQAFIASRTALRLLLGHYTATGPEVVQFGVGPHGKPHLSSVGGTPALRFNLSHSGHYALIALSNGPAVGADIERLRPDVEADGIAERYFIESELAWLRSRPAGARTEAFHRLWVLKEAGIKADGRGLSMPLAEVRVAFDSKDRGGLQSPPWWSSELRIAPEYAAALVIRAEEPTLKSVRRAGFEFQMDHLCPQAGL